VAYRGENCMSIETLTRRAEPPAPLALGGAALFLDLDGTLAPIVDRPEDVAPDPRRNGLLDRLKTGLGGRLAVVSGRTLADIDRILEGRATSVAAVHGLVRRDAEGTLTEAHAHPGLPQALADLRAFAARDPGLLVEDKGLSATLHYRLAPGHAQAAGTEALRIAQATGLAVQPGDMVMELRTPGPSKGDSVRAFMAQPPFAGSIPIFVGDDLTDEDGFAAAADLGGYGVLVGCSRASAARYCIPDVEAALQWLEGPQ
jgi:trehalose 6-phosphate phosphatase